MVSPLVVNFAKGGVLAPGLTKNLPLGFAPTAGNRLVVFLFAGATHTPGTGWTKHLVSLSDGELCVFTKVSDGSETSFSVTQNGARAVSYAAYELPAGTTLSTGVTTTGGTFIDLTGMPSSVQKIGFFAVGRTTTNAAGTATAAFTGTTEDFENFEPYNVTEGAFLAVSHSDSTSTSIPGGTVSVTGSNLGGGGNQLISIAAYLPSAPPANVGPTANAGVDQTVTPGTTVTLSGSGSTDSDGTISTYTWSQVSGTSVSLSGSGVTRTFTPTATGTYVFGLTVTDDDGAVSSQDQVTVTVSASAPASVTASVFGSTAPTPVPNVATDGGPSIMAGDTFYQTVAGTPVGTGIVGGRVWTPASTPATIKIMLFAGPNPALGVTDSAYNLNTTPVREATVSRVAGGWTEATWAPYPIPNPGVKWMIAYQFVENDDTYIFFAAYPVRPMQPLDGVTHICLANSETGAKQSYYRIGTGAPSSPALPNDWYGTDTIVATPTGNTIPVANAGSDQTVTPGTLVTLNASGSTDSDGTIASYSWSQLSGTGVTLSGSGATRNFTPATNGVRVFEVTVTDDDGATATDTVTITVASINTMPIANAGPDQSVNTNATVTLTGAASSDPDGTISSYAWSQTSGSTVTLSGTGPTRTFTPTTAGVRTFQLAVTDNNGATALDEVSVTVSAPGSNFGSSVATENALTGTSPTAWWDGLSALGLPSFARKTYFAPGDIASFSVDCASAFTTTIYRLGHYGGNGARQVATAAAGTPATQPSPVAIPGGNGAVTCESWSQNAQWSVPADALPGWYMALFRRSLDSVHGYALFLVTDVNAKRPTLIVTGDATWHAAYNGFGGNNVYGNSDSIGNIGARAFCSTYDKPVFTHDKVPQTHFYNNTYPYLAWSERMGYEAGVTTIEQIKDDPTILNNRSLIVWVGHNEYIPQQVMNKTKSLLAAGQNMVNVAGNDFFWRVKFTDGAFSSTTNGRVMWCKKDTMSGPASGPNAVPGHLAGQPFTTNADWTGTWQDTRWSLREPSEDFFGDQFIANGIRADAVTVPASMKTMPAWRNCPGVLALTTGQSYSFAAGTLGMEWDRPVMSNLNVVQKLFSSTEIDLVNNASDVNGETYGATSNDTIHAFSMVRKGSSFIANFNSDQWAWALNARHLRGSAAADVNAMQMMLNVISDLGVQPNSSSVTAAGLTVPTPVSMTQYGFTVVPDPEDPPVVGNNPTWDDLVELGYTPYITTVLK